MEVIEMKTRMLLFILVLCFGVIVIGCTKKDGEENGITSNDIAYFIVEDKDVPKEMMEIIKQEKTKGGTQVILNEGSQYVFIGLGERKTGGYGIHINSVEDVEGSISIVYNETKPNPDSMLIQVITYPYVVLRIDSMLPIEITKGKPIIQNANDSE